MVRTNRHSSKLSTENPRESSAVSAFAFPSRNNRDMSRWSIRFKCSTSVEFGRSAFLQRFVKNKIEKEKISGLERLRFLFRSDFADIQLQLSGLSDILEQIKINSAATPSISSRSMVICLSRWKFMVSFNVDFSFRMESKIVVDTRRQQASAVRTHWIFSTCNDKIIMILRRKVRMKNKANEHFTQNWF